MAFHIEECWLFLATDENGEEGLIGKQTALGWLPFVATDQRRIESLRPHAQEIARATGRRVTLVRFAGGREEMEVYD